MLNRFIIIRDQFEGFHKWENAPEKVAFLKNVHRHIFKLEIMIEVRHNDRELEFFMAKDEIRSGILVWFGGQNGLVGSCEQIGEHVVEGLRKMYGDLRYYNVEVSEDGENSAMIEWIPPTDAQS